MKKQEAYKTLRCLHCVYCDYDEGMCVAGDPESDDCPRSKEGSEEENE